MNLLYQVGYFGPIILFISIGCLMFYMTKSLGHSFELFMGFYIFSMVLNHVVKQLLKQPRPRGGKTINKFDKADLDRYGMPSGHANSVAFSLIFSILYFRDIFISLIFALIAFLTVTQRLVYKKHSLKQIGCGAIIGGLLAIICYYSL
jgi:membrane-associated phospholipid phosphatase